MTGSPSHHRDEEDEAEVEAQAQASGALRSRPESSEYEVGYGRPPKHARFQKGRSGNPAGRPKGSKNKGPKISRGALDDILKKEAYREISVREGGAVVTMPVIQAVIRSVFNKALKGDTRAALAIQARIAEIEARESAEQQRLFEALVEYKRWGELELRRRRARGITDETDLLPHPDDVIVNPRTGQAAILGPMTADEVADWDEACAELDATKQILDRLERESLKGELSEGEEEIRADLAKEYEEECKIFLEYKDRKARREGGAQR